MGTAESKALSNELCNFKPVSSRNISYFGEVEILYSRLKNEYILMKRISSKVYSKDQLKIIDALININHPNFILFHGVKQIAEKEYEIYFENILWTLEDEIFQKQEKNEHFSNIEIFDILKEVSSALAHLQKKNIPHQCITTQAILKVASGSYKIVHPLLIGRHQSNRESITWLARFLPPQHGASSPVYSLLNPFKDDTYALAIAIIDACLLGFTEMLLEQRMELVRKQFSMAVWMILEEMLKASESERIDGSLLDYILQDKIMHEAIENDIRLRQRLTELLSRVDSIFIYFSDF